LPKGPFYDSFWLQESPLPHSMEQQGRQSIPAHSHRPLCCINAWCASELISYLSSI
jgi:hypothetical protein